MKTLILVDRYLPHRGGSRRYYHELAIRLPGAVVLTGRQAGAKAFDREAGVRILRRPGIRPNYAVRSGSLANPLLNLLLSYLPGMIAMLGWTALEMLRSRPGVIHAGGYAFAGLAARLLGPLFRVPYMVYAHGEDVSSTLGRRFFRRYMIWVFQGADRIVANCEHTVGYLEQCGIRRERIVVAYPGVDPHRFSSNCDARPAFRGNRRPVLITVGRLTPHKGQATVIRSLPVLIRRWPDLLYRVAGEGVELPRLRALVGELGLERHVELMGGVDEPTLGQVYAGADLFVMPSGKVNGSIEGYGMVYLEAGLAGLAVIGGDSGGVPEAVLHGESGLLVPPFDPEATADAIHHLLTDAGLRNRLAARNRELALERGWDGSLAPALVADRSLRMDQGALWEVSV